MKKRLGAPVLTDLQWPWYIQPAKFTKHIILVLLLFIVLTLVSGELQVTLILIAVSFVHKILHICHRTSEINHGKKLCYKSNIFLTSMDVGNIGWNIMQCSLICSYKHLGGTSYLHSQCRSHMGFTKRSAESRERKDKN